MLCQVSSARADGVTDKSSTNAGSIMMARKNHRSELTSTIIVHFLFEVKSNISGSRRARAREKLDSGNLPAIYGHATPDARERIPTTAF
jgi:hypothetical protein